MVLGACYLRIVRCRYFLFRPGVCDSIGFYHLDIKMESALRMTRSHFLFKMLLFWPC